MSENTQFLCLSVSPGSAETLFGRGGKVNYFSIAYSLGSVCAKNYKIRTMVLRVNADRPNVGILF